MELPSILPSMGDPVSTAIINAEELQNASIGETIYAATLLAQIVSARMGDPHTYHKLATFTDVQGSDWQGYVSPQSVGENAHSHDTSVLEQPEEAECDAFPDEAPVAPIPPDNYCDTLPALGHMLSQLDRFQEAARMNFSRFVEASMQDQRRYLGTPSENQHFKDVAQYLTETTRISRYQARKLVQRGQYFGYRPGEDPNLTESQPVFKELADSLAAGRLPIENADRIIDLDQDLSKYSAKVKQPQERKDRVLQEFEPTLVEAGETATPDELSKAKHRWLVQTAHWICEDGPSPSMALAKQANNELRMREHTDGTATYSMHATADASAAFKNFMLHQLNFNGTPVRISDSALELLTVLKVAKDVDHAAEQNTDQHPEGEEQPAVSDATKDSHDSVEQHWDGEEPPEVAKANISTHDDGQQNQNDQSSEPLPQDTSLDDHTYTPGEVLGPIDTWDTSPDLDRVIAETADGDLVNARYMKRIENLTTGQRIGAILVGLFNTMITMDPRELGAKKAHGSSAQLMIVQDIETAYRTLGIGALPEEAQRPPGIQGMVPTVVKRPTADEPNPPDKLLLPGTPYQSEAVNVGPIHPKDAEILACNSELVGQIWDGPDTVLQQKRVKRLFTPDQRCAILARDKGCQAPGCTTPGVYCDIHHIKAWLKNGPTDEENGIALCPLHHRAVHNGKWTIRKHQGLTFFQPAPWLDPAQPLLRNLYWNT